MKFKCSICKKTIKVKSNKDIIMVNYNARVLTICLLCNKGIEAILFGVDYD